MRKITSLDVIAVSTIVMICFVIVLIGTFAVEDRRHPCPASYASAFSSYDQSYIPEISNCAGDVVPWLTDQTVSVGYNPPLLIYALSFLVSLLPSGLWIRFVYMHGGFR